MFNKLKQFKDLRDQAKNLQRQLEQETITVTTLGGSISLTMDGTMTVKDIKINEELLSPEKKNKLEEGIKEAHKEALKKMQRTMALKMKEMGGLPNIPGFN